MITSCNFCARFKEDCGKGRAELIIGRYPYQQCNDETEFPPITKSIRKVLLRYHSELVELNPEYQGERE